MDANINPIQRGINHSRVNQRFLQEISEESIQSAAKIVQNVADNLQIPEDVIIRKIKALNANIFSNMDDLTRVILNSILKDENTLNYVEDFDKGKKKIVKKEKQNQIFLS
ncbi:hypothetical protein LCGC14_1197270 [marine sediment metagenome]|uniref:Uncharacterized protein n=1 Tax=marine sediment metagenome TaxID=412755 RepID=A0A0F9P0C7_9ZZZZ